MATKYQVVNKFLGYRNKEDITNLPPGVLTVGSRNVLINDGERVAIRQGYELDGQENLADTPIVSSFDWETHLNQARNLRAYYDELEYRYVDALGVVTWRRLKTGWGDKVHFQFVDWWNKDEQTSTLLFVNGDLNIYEWSGLITTVDSVTASTITKQGSTSWAEEGAFTTGTRELIINGVTYTYTGGEDTTTLTGVTPDPTSATFDQTQGTQDASATFGEADSTTKHLYLAQSFVPTNATLVGLQLNKQADTGTFTGTVTVDILADAAGSPTGAPLGSVTLTSAQWLALPAGLFSVQFSSPVALTPATTYWIKLSTSTADNANHPNIGTNSAGGYASGSVKYFDTADGWTAIATIDLFFKTVTAVSPIPQGTIVIQAVRSYANSSATGLPDEAPWQNDLIGILYNQVYLGCLTNRQVYVSKINSFTDYSFSTPRLPGEGALLTFDSNAVGFMPQQDAMYVTAGKNQWYQTVFTLSSDNLKEDLSVGRLKTTGQAAAQSQDLIAKIKNYVFFVSNEPSLDTLGQIELISDPQSTNISDPIKNDFMFYDFTGGQCYYFQNYIFLTVPSEGKVLMFSMARALLSSASETVVSINSEGARVGWEAPQILPISRFATIDGELYGHSSQSPMTFKMFTGYNDNGNPIDAVAAFSYQNYSDRANNKVMDEFYNEGYITTNSVLTLQLLLNYQGCEGTITKQIYGSDPRTVCLPGGDGSLGKQSLGIRSLAGRGETADNLPPKFRIIKSFPPSQFYEMQTIYSSNAIDYHWELLAWGPNAMPSTTTNANITE